MKVWRVSWAALWIVCGPAKPAPYRKNTPNNSSRAAGPAATALARAAAFGCSVRVIALASMILFYL
jgi:hypothetical protein